MLVIRRGGDLNTEFDEPSADRLDTPPQTIRAVAARPSTFREGVLWCEQLNTDAFLITLKKTETDYSPTTMYRDFALSPQLFHWESLSTTSAASPTGLALYRPP